MLSAKGIAGTFAACGSWAAAYLFIADKIDRSSSIVNQSLFNININEENRNFVNQPVKLSSSIRGKMNQFYGHADIEFDVANSIHGTISRHL